MKKKILIAVASVAAAAVLCGGIAAGYIFKTTVRGDKETIVQTFQSMRAAQTEPPEDYWDIWKNSIYKAGFNDERDLPRYGLYIAVGENAQSRAELGLVRRSAVTDLFGRAEILDYAVSENEIGSYLVTDETGNGQTMIFFSANAAHVCRYEAVYLDADGEVWTETDTINPYNPIHCILYGLGTTEKSTKLLQSVAFYAEDGTLVYTYTAPQNGEA